MAEDPRSILDKELQINILKEWPLSTRTINSLNTNNVVYLGDLIALDKSDFLKFRNFGKKSLDEINNLLKKKNYYGKKINNSNWYDIRQKLELKTRFIQKTKRVFLINILLKNHYLKISIMFVKYISMKVKYSFLLKVRQKKLKNLLFRM